MSKAKISFFVSLDGFGAGTDQSLENPLGIRGQELHEWFFKTKSFQQMIGKEGGSEGIDNELAEKSFANVGAWIIGRNMFGPIRGEWKDEEWKGWWGADPPFHTPVFVLTHHERNPVPMKGGTTFYFRTSGIQSVLEVAKETAGGKDIRIGGGVSTCHQFLNAGYVDEIWLAFAPVFLGAGEHLFTGIDLSGLGFKHIQKINGEGATHIFLTKQ